MCKVEEIAAYVKQIGLVSKQEITCHWKAEKNVYSEAIICLNIFTHKLLSCWLLQRIVFICCVHQHATILIFNFTSPQIGPCICDLPSYCERFKILTKIKHYQRDHSIRELKRNLYSSYIFNKIPLSKCIQYHCGYKVFVFIACVWKIFPLMIIRLLLIPVLQVVHSYYLKADSNTFL